MINVFSADLKHKAMKSMNKKPDSYSQPRLDSISESSDRTEFLSTKSTEPINHIPLDYL